MDIVVVGKYGDVDSALRTLTIAKVEGVEKFASDARRSEVEYEHHPTRRAEDSHTCEILVHVRHNLVKGTAASSEYSLALDRALEKVEQQMRRLHARRVGSRSGTRARAARANGSVAEPADDSDGVLGGEDGSAIVVKTKQFSVK